MYVMVPTEMVALLKVLRKLCSNFFYFLCISSYLVSPENLKRNYIQSERTIGNKSDVNLPTLQTGIRLSRSGSFARTSTLDVGSYPRGRPKTTRSPQERQTERPTGQT